MTAAGVAARPAPRLRRDVALLISGTAVGQLAMIASAPLVSRLYEPAEVGAFGTFSAIESMLVVVACLRYDQAVALAPDLRTAGAYLRLALRIALVGSAVVLLAAWTASSVLSSMLGLEHVPWLAVLLAVTVLADAAGQAMAAWAVRNRDLRAVAHSKAVLGGAQSGAQVGLGLAGFGAGGLVAGYAAGRVAAAAVVRRAGGVRATRDATPLAPMARAGWRYPALSAPGALLNAAAQQLPVVLVAALYSPTAAGAMVLATRVAAAPLQLAGQSVTQAFTARIGSWDAPLTGDLRPQVRGVSMRLGAIGAAVAVPIVLLGPSGAEWLLGAGWRDAGGFAQVLAPAFVLQLAASPVAAILALRSRQAVQLAWDAIRVVSLVAVVLLIVAADASALVAVAGMSAVVGTSYAVLLVLVWRAAGPADVTGPRTQAAGGAAPG